MSVVVRETTETTIRCELTRGTGRATVATGQPFLDHMLVAFAKYSGLDLSLQATGDLPHHLIEDVAITAHLREELVPLPEGASYLGFVFARGPSPEQVESALRTAGAAIEAVVTAKLPLADALRSTEK